MTKLQKEYLNNIKSFFSSEIFYEDPEFYGMTENMVTYRQFLDHILSSREFDRIITRIENEYHSVKDDSKFTRSDFIEGYFEHVYGVRIPFNSRIYPNAEAEFNQMMSPGFTFLCLNYLKTGNIHLPYNESHKSQIELIKNNANKSRGNSGCILLIPIIIIITLFLIKK